MRLVWDPDRVIPAVFSHAASDGGKRFDKEATQLKFTIIEEAAQLAIFIE